MQRIRWSTCCGDILDVRADILICSANVYLNLSGGVGGAFLLRYGDEMQRELHRYLAERALRHVPRGSVISMAPCGSPYKAVLHAVAIDAFYDTTPEIVAEALAECLRQAAVLRARTVAAAALATGYGRMSVADFADAVVRVMPLEFPPVESVVIAMRSSDEVDALNQVLSKFAERSTPPRG